MPLRLFWRRHRGHCILSVLRLINLDSREEVILYCARSGRRRRDRPHFQTLVRARAPLCRWDDLSVLHLGDRSLLLHIRRQRRRGRATYTRLGSGGGDGGEGGNWLWPWEGFSKGLVAGGRRTMLFLLLRLGLHLRPLHRAVDVSVGKDAINRALMMDVRKPMAHSPLDFARSGGQLTMQELWPCNQAAQRLCPIVCVHLALLLPRVDHLETVLDRLKLLVGTGLVRVYAAFYRSVFELLRRQMDAAVADSLIEDLCFDKLLHHTAVACRLLVVPIRKLYLHRRLAKRALWVAWLKAHLPERRERVSDSTKVVAREERERLVV